MMPKKPKQYKPRSKAKSTRRIENRESSSRRGYDSKWRTLRASWIVENPLCKHCLDEGITTPAREVDHIKPFDPTKKNDPLRLNRKNLQSLCRRCHAIKTAKEQGKG